MTDSTFTPAQGWRTSNWDEAKSAGRILLVWKAAQGLVEHVELGKWSGIAWTNTYGKPFSGDPDGWAPLKPFAAQPPAAPVETGDLVKRLRTKHIYGSFEIEQQRQEAADTIERLSRSSAETGGRS